MIKNGLAIIFYILAGFFFVCIGMMLGINDPQPPPYFKLLVLSIFLIFGLIALFPAIGCSGPLRWKKNTGILFINIAFVESLVLIGFITFYFTPELRSAVKDPSFFAQQDYLLQVLYIAVTGLLGTVMLTNA